MRALVKKDRAPGVSLVDIAEPDPIKSNELLIRIRRTSVCGTDVHIDNWDDWAAATLPHDLPMTIGHEFMGVVEQVGESVEGFSVGDRVTGEGHITCGHCRNCRAGRRHLCRETKGVGVTTTGCFSDLFVLPAGNAFRVPDHVSDDLAAIFDPFGNAVHTALSFDLVGEDVLITGAGPIGIMAAMVAKTVGARNIVITDLHRERLKLASELGATEAFDPREEELAVVMERLGMTEGFDVGLEMSGSVAAFRSMLNVMNHGGRIASLGIFPAEVPVDWSHVIFKGLTIKGIYGREMFETWYKMAALLHGNLGDTLSRVITGRYEADDYEKAFAEMREGRCGKIILEW